MGKLLRMTDPQEFSRAGRIPESAITDTILSNVAKLDETGAIEPWLREIIHDPNETPHGPTEIADILTTHVTVGGVTKLAGFVNKGRSSTKVTARKVTHQFMRLSTIRGIQLAVFAAVGDIQDDALRDFVQVCRRENWDYLILDKIALARLFIAYHMICPKDGLTYEQEFCPNGHQRTSEISIRMKVREDPRGEIIALDDVSHAGAKRLSATILVDPHYSNDVIRELLPKVVKEVRSDEFVRNKLVQERWGTTPAHVVWVYVAACMADASQANWVCRACWIDSDLPDSMRPTWDETEDVVDGVMIVWNDLYNSMKSFLGSATGSKGKLVQHVQVYLERVKILLDEVRGKFAKIQNSLLAEADFIEYMKETLDEVEAIYREGTDGPMPPVECTDYDQILQNILSSFHNLWLFYTSPNFLQREAMNRQWLFQQNLQDVDKEFLRLSIEAKKIGLA